MNLTNALMAGYTAQDIVKQLLKRFPDLAPKLQMAAAAGYSAEDMVKYISKLKPKEVEKISKYEPGGYNPLIQGQKAAEVGGPQGQALTSAAKGLGSLAVGAGGAALGTYALGRALPFVATQLGFGGAPSLPPQQPAPDQIAPGINNNMAPGAPTAQPPPSAGGEQAPFEDIPKHVDIIKKLGFEDHIKRQSHLSPEDVAATIDFVMSPGQKKWLSEQTSAPIQKVVSDYISASAMQAPPEISDPKESTPIQPEKSIQEAPDSLKPYLGKNVGSIVSVGGLPGRIESIKKDIAKVNVDGKIRHLKLKDVEEAPEDVQQAVIRMLDIPEYDRSAVTAYFGYNPEDKSLAVQYHNGNLYTYDNVDEAKVHKMANKLGIPTTTGGNIFGEWEQGKQDSLGAALIAEIVKDPAYSKENKNKTWRKYETGYDYWEKLRRKPKPKPPQSKLKAERSGKKPDDDKEHGVKRKKKPKIPE